MRTISAVASQTTNVIPFASPIAHESVLGRVLCASQSDLSEVQPAFRPMPVHATLEKPRYITARLQALNLFRTMREIAAKRCREAVPWQGQLLAPEQYLIASPDDLARKVGLPDNWREVAASGCVVNADPLKARIENEKLTRTWQPFHQVTPEDVDWAERQTAFPHPHVMPRLLTNFCPKCVDAVTDGGLTVGVTRGVYLPIEHGCNSVRVYDLHGKLLKTVSHEEFYEQQAKNERKRQQVCGNKTANPVMFKAARSVKWRQTHSAMGKLMRLLDSVAPHMPESVDLFTEVDDIPYKQAFRYLLVCKRWLTEKRMVRKGLCSEARSLDEIVSESRLFAN